MGTSRTQGRRWPAAVALAIGFAVVLIASTALAADPKRNLAVSKPAAPAAAGERRVALVIGNGAYKDAPLKNPVNDARAIARTLQGLGFQVIQKENAGLKEMQEAIRVFGDRLRGGGVGLFCYAGHGMQVKGRNYLIPVNTDIQREDEVTYNGVDANLVLEKMDTAKNRVNLVILDACRNNPFARSFRSAARGLVPMEAPVGTLVAFATAPGSVAADGNGANGLYTQHLLGAMNQPGLRIEDVFKRVRAGVRKGSGGKQIPWENTSLEGDFYFKPGKPGEAPTQLASLAPALESESAPGMEATGETWTEPTTGMEFVWVPKGCFQMGSPEHEKDRSSDERRHEVCIEGYWMAKYEVTNAQYRKFRSDHGADDKLPVTEVSWRDAMHFAQWLSEKSGKKIRLPTEAEWEYAARAGTSTAYFWGDSWDGRHNYVSSEKKPVGSYQPNAFGLYDMLGNVREWTASNYDSSYAGAERQVASLDAGGGRVIRGGSWSHLPRHVRSANRYDHTPGARYFNLGLRLARTP
jgi:formylglycine-generating enzyme required for sulfatase activity